MELQSRLAEGDVIADHYRVLGIAGAGGMGVVYRAHDVKLERTVALKLLPPSFDLTPRDEERLLREARTASSLDHPHIGVIYEVGATPQGRHFIVMAFYDGASLAERIQQGPLSSSEAVEIARQMAEGLAEAHSRGIVHRDIKPSNVMLTANGTAKIVDFGLAQGLSMATATQTGTTGTIAYMSPEQALSRAVDQRTDLWALGVTLAEMLSGANPFARDSVPAMLFAILNEAPRGIETTPAALQPVLYRCLAKEADKRYATAQELLDDLGTAQAKLADTTQGTPVPAKTPIRSMRESAQTRRVREQASRSTWNGAQTPSRRPPWWAVGPVVLALGAGGWLLLGRARHAAPVAATASEQHVAVLPFENIGSTPENTIISAGLMDSLAGRLSDLQVGGKSLWVVPDSEVRRLKITDPAEAWQQLHANLVVKGSIERDGEQVQLHVNLIDTKDLRQVGSVEVHDQAGDLATLENETVARLAQLMHIPVTGDMLRTTDGAVNSAAYEDYLTALGYMQRYDKPGNLDLAIASLKKSTTTDPRFAVGYAALGEAYRLKYRTAQDPQGLTEAEANCQKAIQLNDHLPEPYVTLGKVHDSAGQHELALQEFQHALELNPRDPTASAGLAHAYEHAGRMTDAEAAYHRSVDLSPENWDGYNNLGMFLQRVHKYPDAVGAYKKALQLTPENSNVILNLGGAYLDAGDPNSLRLAEGALRQSIAITPTYAAYANIGLVYYHEHEYPDAAAMTQKAIDLNASDYGVWQNLRLAEEWLGDARDAEIAASRERPLLLAYVAANPNDADAEASYANLVARYGPKEQALSHLRKALALAPDDPDVLEVAASSYLNLGNTVQGVAYLKQAFSKGFSIKDAEDDPEIRPLLESLRTQFSGLNRASNL